MEGEKNEQTCVFGCPEILALNPTSHQLRAAASKLQQPQTSGDRLWAFRVKALGGEHHNQNFDYASSLKAMVCILVWVAPAIVTIQVRCRCALKAPEMWGRAKNGLIIMLMGELLQHLLIQHIRCHGH